MFPVRPGSRGRVPGSRLFWARATVTFLVAATGGGCAIGTGDGELVGQVSAPTCGLLEEDFSLDPTFFGANPILEDQLEIRIQHGSDFESKSDGIVLLVADIEEVKQSKLGEALDLSTARDAPVRMSFYLHETCPPDALDVIPVHYEAVEGTVVFQSIYAPGVSTNEVEISGQLNGVRLVDPDREDERWAELDGSFRFLYVRGAPRQRFP